MPFLSDVHECIPVDSGCAAPVHMIVCPMGGGGRQFGRAVRVHIRAWA